MVSFGGANGVNPAGKLVQGSDGNFYGTTPYGGAFDLGTVFKMTTDGVLTNLLSFNGTNGANPAAGLIQGTNGLLYGTTQYGGTNDLDFGGDGTVFKITTNGVLTRPVLFRQRHRWRQPHCRCDPGKRRQFLWHHALRRHGWQRLRLQNHWRGVLTTLYSFTGGNDGATPDGGVIQGKDGNFYGTTAYGGANDVDNGGDGTVFKMTSGGVLTTLLSFSNTNGYDPEAAVVQGADGLLYGTTASGGTNGQGTAFKITTNGVFTALISFDGANGAQPQAGLVQATDGNFYGTTVANGAPNIMGGYGTVFKLGTNGTLSTLYIFGDNNPNGATPVAGLVAGADGNFYGTTVYGGTNHGSFGSVFKLATNGTHTLLVSFNGTNGAYPQAALVVGADGNFYGTTAYGGTNATSLGGDGTVFKITTNGVLTTLASFSGTNGANPLAGLAQTPDGIFYGTTQNGGTNDVATGGDGAIFKFTTNGILTRLASFNVTKGANPVAGLTLGPDGNFYGMTPYGGTNDVATGGDGIVFRVATNGTLTRLLSFNGANGANPLAGLTLGTNGSFYGTTSTGGDDGYGTLFKITTNGVLTTLYSFTGEDDGASPAAGLLLSADGNFYGTTSSGGAAYSGAAFQITHEGVFNPLYSFTGENDGAQPVGVLAEGVADYFFGATQLGGTNGAGTLFQLFINPYPFITTQPTNLTTFTGTTASFAVSALGAAPLNYQWLQNSTILTDHSNISGSTTRTLTLTNVSLADTAGYSVIVSNAVGVVTSTVAILIVINPFPPAVTTEAATPVGINSATLNASVNPDGATTTAWFDWGLTTNYDNVSAVTNVGSGGDLVSVSLDVTGLQSFTEYHFAAVAGNGLGTNTGLDMSFFTPGALSNVTFTPLVSFASTNGTSPQAGLWQGADGDFYGTTHDGGDYNEGTVYKMTNGVLTTLLSFNGTNGSHPAAGLVLGPDSQLYGTTYDGGTNDLANGGDGTVFKITTNGAFTNLLSFNATNGANPAAGLALGADGNFYGTTENGGTNDLANGGDGTVFRITTNGVLTSLFSFNGTNGANPDAALTLANDGNFYGTTSGGGADDSGTVFKITTNGLLTTLYSFTGGEDGEDPQAGLVQGPDGDFYGTTAAGGDYDAGTVYEITTNGVLTTLNSFTGGLDGSAPEAALVLGADGNFYGTTSSGGVDGNGTVFVVTPGGAFATLVLLDSTLYGAGAQAELVLGANDNLYGVAASGGTNGSGTVFSIRLGPSPSIVAQPASFTNFAGTAAIFTVAAIGAPPLHYCWQRSATNLTDGGNISGSATSTLTLTNLALTDSAGYSVIVTNAYGAGTSAVATLTVINPFPPAVTTLDATAVGINGATLNASVNPDGATTTAWFVWGITTNYGNSTTVTNVGDGGDVVSVSLDLGGLQSFTEYHFAAVAGNSLGTNTGADLSFITPGALSNIVFTPLLSFDGTNGGDAHCGLMQAVDGNFYGTTYDGGDYDLGTVYQMTTRGVINILFSFDGTNGSHPEAGLVQGPDSQLYGTTYDGGINDTASGGDGTVFKITTNGVFTNLLSFNGTNGANPTAALLLGPDGQFYGTTYSGGVNDITNGGYGTIFKVATNGLLTPLLSFASSNGANPAAGLILASDGNFYGATAYGGTNDVDSGGDGTVFRMTTNGILASLASFNGTNGANPVAALVQGADGYLYGTTQYGGTNDLDSGGDGTIFKITTNGVLTTFTRSPVASMALTRGQR